VGQYTSITIGAEGFPVISYYDVTNGDLKVAKCGNASCSSGNTLTTIDSVGDVGIRASITIGTDGFPVISYYDFTNEHLKVAKCGNASCSSDNTLTTVDSAYLMGYYSSITIGADGFPVISYYHDSTQGSLWVAKCGNASCSSGNTLTQVTSGGKDQSIAIGVDGFPVISYCDSANINVKMVKCGNASCSLGNTLTTVDSAGNTDRYTSITIGADGFPVISYYDATNLDLKVAKCGNVSCSSGNTLTTIDSVGDVGQYTSITIGADGYPVISYYDNTNHTLKVAKCANQYCLNNWWRR
jgi:hypothetical protein